MTTSDTPTATTDGWSSTTPTSTAGMDPMGAATRPPDEQGTGWAVWTGPAWFVRVGGDIAEQKILYGVPVSRTGTTRWAREFAAALLSAASWSPEDSA